MPAGQPRGEAGPYEQWTGVVHFAIDPEHAANKQIVDLNLAPRNAGGKVEFSADFRMLVPVDRAKANGAVFYEVNNRGNPTRTRIIDGGADDFLCRQGFVVLWSGWIAEVQPDGGKLRLQAPVTSRGIQPIRGTGAQRGGRRSGGAAGVDLAPRESSAATRRRERGLAEARVTRREREADERQVDSARRMEARQQHGERRRPGGAVAADRAGSDGRTQARLDL